MTDVRLALSTYTYPWSIGLPGHPPRAPMSHLDLLDRAVDLGVRVVQIADNRPLDESGVDALGRDAQERGIAVEIGTRGLGPGLVRSARIAAALGATFVRVVVDTPENRPSPDQALDRLASFREQFRRLGLVLAIENHDRFRAHELADIVRRSGDWVGVCLDTANSLGRLETVEHVVGVLGPFSVNLHLKDVTIRRHPSGLGFEVVGTPLGEGVVPLDWVLAELGRHGRVHSAALELWTPPADDLDATIAREHAWAARSVSWVRTHTDLL